MKIKLLLGIVLLCTIVKAQTNTVLNFNGSSNYVNMGNSVGSNIRSIEFWFKPTTTITPSISQTNVFIGRNDATELHEYGFYVEGAEYPAADRGKVTFYLSDNGNYYYVSSNNNSWTAGTWYHVCGTIDVVTGMKLYINGALQTGTDPYTSSIPPANEITALGRWGDLSMRYFSGRMDEVRFWDRTLSQPEIQQKQCSYLNPANETGLTGYWKMNEGSGTTIFDVTASANSGTLLGATFIQDQNCISGTVDIAENIEKTGVSVYPNPFSYAATLKTNGVLSNATLIIYNSIGQEVKQIRNISGEEITIERDDLPTGMYIISLSQDNRKIAIKKMVITDN
ncbi:MAG: LamG-like jellyroll fold domain-containing protein [Bacteroidota bacterium]|nr:LamG-like jellyroll fold domain-containing protein [Bacteroidota bacterium]